MLYDVLMAEKWGRGVGGGGEKKKRRALLRLISVNDFNFTHPPAGIYSPLYFWYSQPPDSTCIPDFPLLVSRAVSVSGPSEWTDLSFPLLVDWDRLWTP